LLRFRYSLLLDRTLIVFRDFITNKDTGKLYKAGETMKRPKLAQTLETIANEGPDAFYSGSLSADIVDDITEAGTLSFVSPFLHVIRSC